MVDRVWRLRARQRSIVRPLTFPITGCSTGGPGQSYGDVWLARNVLGTYRAVKGVCRDAFSDERPYEREFAGIRKYEPVSRTHEGQVDVLQVGRNEAAGYFYCVMELADAADGAPSAPNPSTRSEAEAVPRHAASVLEPDRYASRTLREVVAQRGCLPLNECLEIGISRADALEQLYRHRLVHRDAICAQSFVTRSGLTGSSEQVVAPKVGVTREAHRPEPKNPTGIAGPAARAIRQSRPELQTSTPRPGGSTPGLSPQGGPPRLARGGAAAPHGGG